MVHKWLGFCAGRDRGSVTQETRAVPICGTAVLPYRDNYASTTKYTLLSYLPKALFEQYRRVANIFFTLMAALSLTPWSPLRPWTTWTPLVLVVGVSMVKEAQEDYKRYKQDKAVNERLARALDRETGEFRTMRWRYVRAGDVLQVQRDEFLPADLILLASSNPEGTCYVETMNLDGETNLKIKVAPDETKGISTAELHTLVASVECEGPNSRLYQFTGNLRIEMPLPPSVIAALAAARALAAAGAAAAMPASGWGRAAAKTLELQGGDASAPGKADGEEVAVVVPAAAVVENEAKDGPESTALVGPYISSRVSTNGGSFVVPLSSSSLLLRGCSLRNTESVYGVVVYAGHDTKVFMNSTEPPSKRSHVERMVDKIIMCVFGLLFTWCLISAVYHVQWTRRHFQKHWYMRPDSPSADSDPDSPTQTGIVSFFIALLLYSYLVPISLYVSIEMVKVFQAMVLISADRDMYHAETDTPAQARTSNLNEELGMVAAVMSDKTGTLTRNVMEFFKCSIAGVAYGDGVTEIEKTNLLRQGTVAQERDDPEAAKYRERFFNFYDERLMGGAWSSASDPDTVEMFFRLLAVCHTVIPDGPTEPESIKYEAESPDEAALVVAAKAFGFFFFKRTNTTVTVRENTASGVADVEYEVLNILEFNSTRKRMSVVIKDKANDKIILFTKGADTVIYERLDAGYAPNEAMKESTSRHMEDFGAAGLRTLCLSYAEIDRNWYTHLWLPEWVAAKTSLLDRDEKVADVSEKIERNLRLLGCTAIEDKLQEGVGECIQQLALAGIRIWVLTGDKTETAINIGFACSLLREDMERHTVTVSSPRVEELEKAGRKEEAEALSAELVAKQLDKIESSFKISGISGRTNAVRDTAGNAALIIDGKALAFALSKTLSPAFLRVGLRCKAVVCCRVSPLQKAQVTTLVRSTGSITLAIGDGANDVGMIQRAHIGVGISGQEGMQAVMSADFAIAQFRYLVPLLLVHGQYSYKRLTRMICFFFYKNLLLAITLFTYSALSTFSGSFIYNDTSMTLFNVLFTSATPLIIGMFDRPLGKRLLLRYPQLYRRGVANASFNPGTILSWMLAAVMQSAVLLAMVLQGASGTAASGSHGIPYGMAEVGAVLFTAILFTVHLQVAIIEEAWTWLHHAAIGGSIALWFLYLIGFGSFPVNWSLEMWQLFRGIVAPNAQFWLFCLLVPLAALMPVAAYRAFSRLLFPSDEDIIRELGKVERSTSVKERHPHASPPQPQQPPQLQQLPTSPRKRAPSQGVLTQLGSSQYHGGSGNRVAPEPTAPPQPPPQTVSLPPRSVGSVALPGSLAFATLTTSFSGDSTVALTSSLDTHEPQPLLSSKPSSSVLRTAPSRQQAATSSSGGGGGGGPSRAASQGGMILMATAGSAGGGGGTRCVSPAASVHSSHVQDAQSSRRAVTAPGSHPGPSPCTSALAEGRLPSREGPFSLADRARTAGATRSTTSIAPTASVTRGRAVLPSPSPSPSMELSQFGMRSAAGSAPPSALHALTRRKGSGSVSPRAPAVGQTAFDAGTAAAAVAAVAAAAAAAAGVNTRVTPLHRGSDGRFTESGPHLMEWADNAAGLQPVPMELGDGEDDEAEYEGEVQPAGLQGMQMQRSVHGPPLPLEDLG